MRLKRRPPRMTNQIMEGHDEMYVGVPEMTDLAQIMVGDSAAPSAAFSSDLVRLGSLESLVDEQDAIKQGLKNQASSSTTPANPETQLTKSGSKRSIGDDDDDNENSDEELTEEEEPPKQAWFDRDSAVTTAMRTQKGWITGMDRRYRDSIQQGPDLDAEIQKEEVHQQWWVQ